MGEFATISFFTITGIFLLFIFILYIEQETENRFLSDLRLHFDQWVIRVWERFSIRRQLFFATYATAINPIEENINYPVSKKMKDISSSVRKMKSGHLDIKQKPKRNSSLFIRKMLAEKKKNE